ncbi:MAG: hypothetical protein RR269_05610 [Oscillospiraceae bacterium]
MAIRPKDVYKGRQKSKSFFSRVLIVILLALILAGGLFYGLRHIAVYDKDGNATIVFPFSRQAEPKASPQGK